MNTKQDIVAAAGMGLIIADFWLGNSRAPIAAGIFGRAGGSAGNAHADLKKYAGELLFVAVATLIAGVSDGAGSAMIAVMVALGVLWSIHHYTKGN